MMDAGTRQKVRDRAGDRCEYCKLEQKHSPIAALQIDHIVPRKHGGSDDLDNLALACIDCNLAKSTNIAGLDPITGQLTALFHPRKDNWQEPKCVYGSRPFFYPLFLSPSLRDAKSQLWRTRG